MQVRAALMTMLGLWQLQLPERLETEARLLPYLVAGLWDVQPEAAAAAGQALDALGALYEHDNAQDLQAGPCLARHVRSCRRCGDCVTVAHVCPAWSQQLSSMPRQKRCSCDKCSSWLLHSHGRIGCSWAQAPVPWQAGLIILD